MSQTSFRPISINYLTISTILTVSKSPQENLSINTKYILIKLLQKDSCWFDLE